MNFDARFPAGNGEGGVLGEEAVAGVDCLGAGGLSRFDDFDDVQVAFGRGSGAEKVRFVGHANVEGVPVRLGVDCDGSHAQPLAATDNAAGYLSTVGYENFAEHGYSGNYTRLGLGWGEFTPISIFPHRGGRGKK